MNYHREKYLAEEQVKFNRMTGTEQIQELYRLVREVERRLDSNCNVLLETLESHRKEGVARFEITDIKNNIDLLFASIGAYCEGADNEYAKELSYKVERANKHLKRDREKIKAQEEYRELKFKLQELKDTYNLED